MERIAERAGCSAGLLYSYFDGKQALFDALYEQIVSRTHEEIPTVIDDLPEQTARIYDGQRAYPEVIRLTLWHLLEADEDVRIETATRGNAMRVAELADAQRDGRIPAALSPEQLQTLIVAIASMWSTLPRETLDLVPDQRVRRETIVEVMRRIVGD